MVIYKKDDAADNAEHKPSTAPPLATAGQTNIHSYPALCKIFKICPKIPCDLQNIQNLPQNTSHFAKYSTFAPKYPALCKIFKICPKIPPAMQNIQNQEVLVPFGP